MKEKSLQEVLYENKMKVRKEIEERKQAKKYQKRVNVIKTIFFIGVVIITVGSIVTLQNKNIQNERGIENVCNQK